MPVYPTTKGLNQTSIRQAIENALALVNEKLEESLPEYIVKQYNLMSLEDATNQIHFPSNMEKFNLARKRLAFEELLTFQLALLSLKTQYDSWNKI